MTTTCYIYRCAAKADMYLYLYEKDDFTCLPEKLQKNIGVIEFTMKLELYSNIKLAKEDPEKIMHNLKTQGFHIQMPNNTPVDQLLENIARASLRQHPKT